MGERGRGKQREGGDRRDRDERGGKGGREKREGEGGTELSPQSLQQIDASGINYDISVCPSVRRMLVLRYCTQTNEDIGCLLYTSPSPRD